MSATGRFRVTERSPHGIDTSGKPESFTHLSGTFRHLCLGSLRSSMTCLRGLPCSFASPAQAMTADSSSAFTLHKPCLADLAGMAHLIPFPLGSRTALVRSIVDDLECVHGPAASAFWRARIAEIVAGMRATGLPDAAIRNEILDLQDAVQTELCERGAMAKNKA